jgi:hypothetical protein
LKRPLRASGMAKANAGRRGVVSARAVHGACCDTLGSRAANDVNVQCHRHVITRQLQSLEQGLAIGHRGEVTKANDADESFNSPEVSPAL